MISARIQGVDALIVSAAEKNAIEVLSRCARWVEWLKKFGVQIVTTTDSKSEISFLGAGKILSLSQNPDTVRGFTGNVYLDEFAHHSHDQEIYDALFPVASLGYKVTILSSPMGQSGSFYNIWADINQYRDYSRHRIDINDAIANGARVDVEALRRNTDAETFAQEYLCEFVDESTAFIPYNTIRGCISSQPNLDTGRNFLGVDIARRRDLTVLMVLTELDGKFYTKRLERMRGQTFAAQRSAIERILSEEKIERGAVDSTGLGMQMAEELNRKYHFLEPVTFTAQSKERMAFLTKRIFDNRQIQIPADNDLISAIHGIRKTVTPSNSIRFDAERDDKGHADEFWALALALDAARTPQMIVRQY